MISGASLVLWGGGKTRNEEIMGNEEMKTMYLQD